MRKEERYEGASRHIAVCSTADGRVTLAAINGVKKQSKTAQLWSRALYIHGNSTYKRWYSPVVIFFKRATFEPRADGELTVMAELLSGCCRQARAAGAEAGTSSTKAQEDRRWLAETRHVATTSATLIKMSLWWSFSCWRFDNTLTYYSLL